MQPHQAEPQGVYCQEEVIDPEDQVLVHEKLDRPLQSAEEDELPSTQVDEGPTQATFDGGPVEKKSSVNNVGAIPNGGLRAWLQVVGAFFLFFNSW